MRSSLLFILLALAMPAAAQEAVQAPRAAVQADPAFDARVAQLLGILQGRGDYAGYFAPAFVAEVPKAALERAMAQLAASHGTPDAILGVRTDSPWAATLRVRFGNDVAVVALAIDPKPPHQVTGLLIKGFETHERSLDEVAAAMARLPGRTGFAVAKLGTGAPQWLARHDADIPLAIGSAFKLVILAELVRATNARERGWDDTVTLDGKQLPAGGYRGKPAGTKVTLRELATQMISISDNSATDLLLHALGREEVEAMMPVLGIADPARNRPFLSTMEVFKLKGFTEGDFAGRYLAKDEAGRRAMLDGEVADALPAGIRPNLFIDGKPARIDTLEWFESAADLVRVMDWLRRNSEGPGGAEARAVLAKNPGIPAEVAAKWRWVGFKGGSEPGVLNFTLLLQAKSGDWYAIAASWNDTAKDVDTARFYSLIGKAAELAAPAP